MALAAAKKRRDFLCLRNESCLLCSSDTGVRLFKRVRRGTAFATSAVNRRGQTAAGPTAAEQASTGNLDSVDEDEVSPA